MDADISYQEMYRLINEAVSECFNDKDIAINKSMQSFQQKHWNAVKQHRQLKIFEAPIPSSREVHQATDFCNLLDNYRIYVDVFNEEETDLSTDTYRRLYQGIEYYRPYITKDNQKTLDVLSKNIRKKLPEYKDEELIAEYNIRAIEIQKLKKEYDKNKKKNPNATKLYEQKADDLFKDILQKKELARTAPSVNKLTAYSNILNVVDCLPNSKYSRTKKYHLKYSINFAIGKICQHLGDNYALAQINAEKNANKYLNAMDNIKQYGYRHNNDYSSFRNKKLRDEYTYK